MPEAVLAISGNSGLVAEYIVAIDVTRVRFPADAYEVKGGMCSSPSIAPKSMARWQSISLVN